MAELSETVEQQAVRDASAVYSVAAEVATAEDVPPGYKPTEVGVIPEDWEVKHLSELGITYAGLTYKPSNVRSFGSLVLRSSNIKDGKLVFNSDDVYVDATIPPRAIVREGDILICVRNGSARLIGKCARIPKSAAGHAFGAFMTVFRANDDGLTFYLFQSDIVQRQIQERMGATINQITGKDLSEFLVPVPTAPGEQRAIASALSDADALIESLDRLIAKKRAIKQAAMQQLLTGQTRLPGFTGEWETKRLGDIGTFYKGQGIRRDDVSDEGVPCIRYGEIYTQYGDCVVTPESHISETVAETAFPLRCGDVLFAGSGETAEEIGMCVAYLGEKPAFAGGDIVVLRPNEGVSAYLGRLLNHPTIAQEKARLGQGDAVVHISARNLAQIEVHLPKQEEQTAIATALSDMDAEIEVLERRRDKARQLKQGMMQQLLTGRVRLVEPESLTEATV